VDFLLDHSDTMRFWTVAKAMIISPLRKCYSNQ